MRQVSHSPSQQGLALGYYNATYWMYTYERQIQVQWQKRVAREKEPVAPTHTSQHYATPAEPIKLEDVYQSLGLGTTRLNTRAGPSLGPNEKQWIGWVTHLHLSIQLE